MKRIFVLFLYNIIVIAFLCGLLEFSVRIFIPEIRLQGTDKRIIADSVYYESSGLKPNTCGISNERMVNVDKYGFRAACGKYDFSRESILLIGDSVTMGIGVDNDSTFAGRLQNSLKDKNILNLSMFGYNLKDYQNVYRFYRENDLFRRYNIKSVVICWCLNDIYLGDVNDKDTPGGNVRNSFSSALTSIRKNSKAYVFLKNLFFDRPKSYFMYDKQFYANENSNLKESVSILKSIAGECAKAGVEFAVLLLPYEYQLRNYNDSHIYSPQKLLAENLTNGNIKILEPYRFLHSFSNGESASFFLYADGIHYSDRGHSLLEKYLSPVFAKK